MGCFRLLGADVFDWFFSFAFFLVLSFCWSYLLLSSGYFVAPRDGPPKARAVDRAVAAFDDDLSIIDVPSFAKASKKGARLADAGCDEAAKRAKALASRRHAEKEMGPTPTPKEKR